MASQSDQPAAKAGPSRKLGSLHMVWRFASRYPLQLVIAAVALCIAALATLAIPYQFKAMIDSGFIADVPGDPPTEYVDTFDATSGTITYQPARFTWSTTEPVSIDRYSLWYSTFDDSAATDRAFARASSSTYPAAPSSAKRWSRARSSTSGAAAT